VRAISERLLDAILAERLGFWFRRLNPKNNADSSNLARKIEY
jgi:hypothetical protein